MSWGDNILQRLASKELILPVFENQMRFDEWPDSYQVKVDSSPYYGAGDGFFHPSTHPLMPARQLYYMFHPDTRDKIVPEANTLQRQMTLSVHSAIHAVIQTQMQMTGLVVSEEDIEVEYVNHEHHVRGRIDFIVDHPTEGRVPVELKGQNPYSFRKQETIKPEWDAQLSLALDNVGADFGILMVLETGWPYQLKEYRVQRNDALLSEIYTKFDLVREAIATNTPPRHCCMPDSPEMKVCPARMVCWLKPKGQL